jgi:glycosidase
VAPGIGETGEEPLLWYVWTDNPWLNPPDAYRDAFVKGYSRRNSSCATSLEQYRKTAGRGYINLPLGNHDLSRLNVARSTDDLDVIYALSLTMPGIPFLFQGNEIGMRQLHDMPYVEGAYKPRPGGRSPMQWSRGPNLRFSNADASKLYLPVDPDPDPPNVAEQERGPRSLLDRVRRLIRLKKTETAQKAYADFVPVYAKADTYPFVYARVNHEAAVLVILNPAGRETKASFELQPEVRGHELLAGRTVGMEYASGHYRLTVPGRSYAIYRILR